MGMVGNDGEDAAMTSGDDDNDDPYNRLINPSKTTTATTSITTTTTDIDEALEKCGPFGWFQLAVQLYFMCIVLSSAFQATIVYFIGANIPWTCVNANSSTFCTENFGEYWV